jgi:hypothetical protein
MLSYPIYYNTLKRTAMPAGVIENLYNILFMVV